MEDKKKFGFSVIIPTRNEEDYIEECINSLLDSFELSYIDNTEFIIVDGMSTDRTVDIVKEKFSHINLKILENPNLYQSYAMNIGIENSNDSAEFSLIIRADAHCRYPPNYIFNCYQASRSSRGGNAGSIQKAIGTNIFTRAVATVMNSKFGMGGVKYRRRNSDENYFNREENYMEADTAYLGCWRKSDLVNLGGFNEEFQINEDYELNIRIRKSGKLVTVNENLEVSYYVRNSLFGLVKQFFRYGLWKTKTLSIHPDSLKKRQLAPVLFVLFLVSLGIGYSILPYYQVLNWIIGIVGFLWLILIISIWKNSPRIINIFLIPIVVLSMHISWGLGFLFGLTRWIRGGWKS